jgi:hypothetical protein
MFSSKQNPVLNILMTVKLTSSNVHPADVKLVIEGLSVAIRTRVIEIPPVTYENMRKFVGGVMLSQRLMLPMMLKQLVQP